MSNLAQEEADRLFSQKQQTRSHPEDVDDSSEGDVDVDDEKPRSRTHLRPGTRRPNPDSSDDESDNDNDTAANMTSLNGPRSTYTLPSQVHHANTGPKGVIADAQSYHRAKQSTFRKTLHSISNNLSLRPRTGTSERPSTLPSKPVRDGNGISSGEDIPTSEDDDEFMAQWREQRLAELQGQYGLSSDEKPTQHKSQSQSQRQRSYGSLEPVNASGYLNAIETTPLPTTVLVLLYDPDRTSTHYARSEQVEHELEQLAYKYHWVRMVKLHHEIAEMESLDVPAILAYRGGDVFATVSGAEGDGLEDGLLEQGVFVRR